MRAIDRWMILSEQRFGVIRVLESRCNTADTRTTNKPGPTLTAFGAFKHSAVVWSCNITGLQLQPRFHISFSKSLLLLQNSAITSPPVEAMRNFKFAMLVMCAMILVISYLTAKSRTFYTNPVYQSTHSRYAKEEREEIEYLDTEIRILNQHKRQIPVTDDDWQSYPEDILKNILAIKAHATDLINRHECRVQRDVHQFCMTLLYLESHLQLDLANNDIKTMRKHAIKAKAAAEIETGLAVVDTYMNKHKPPLFLRDLAYIGTDYLKMIVLREAIERMVALFRFGPRINVLGNF